MLNTASDICGELDRYGSAPCGLLSYGLTGQPSGSSSGSQNVQIFETAHDGKEYYQHQGWPVRIQPLVEKIEV